MLRNGSLQPQTQADRLVACRYSRESRRCRCPCEVADSFALSGVNVIYRGRESCFTYSRIPASPAPRRPEGVEPPARRTPVSSDAHARHSRRTRVVVVAPVPACRNRHALRHDYFILPVGSRQLRDDVVRQGFRPESSERRARRAPGSANEPAAPALECSVATTICGGTGVSFASRFIDPYRHGAWSLRPGLVPSGSLPDERLLLRRARSGGGAARLGATGPALSPAG